MPLHINLYHEVQKQAQARRRDPLKLGMLALLVVGVAFVGYYFVRLGQAHEVSVRFANLQQEWEKLEVKQQAAKAREDALNADIRLSEDLGKRIESRFFWAPVMAQVISCMPREIQLVKLNGTTPQDASGAPTMSLSGLASSASPRRTAEEMRTELETRFTKDFKDASSSFKSLDDSEEFIVIEGKRCATVSFSIDFRLDRGEEPAPVVTRRKIAAK